MAKKWLQFAALIPAVALSFMDQSILPVALPTIQKELGASDVQLQWCVNSYLLAITVFVLISGKISDWLGHRNILFWGMVGFALSSGLCALSQDPAMLIGARALQGLSAAMMFPAQAGLLPRIFPPEARGKTNGMLISIGSLFLIVGPLVGGYLTEIFSWRSIFWINLPIAAIGLWLIRAFLPTSEPVPLKIDFRGFLFFAVGTTALTLLFMQVGTWGWHSQNSYICIALTTIFLILLLKRELTAPHPFLELSLFKRSVFTAITINVAIVQFIMMITVFRTIYIQEILGYTPVQTGLLTFASASPVLFMSTVAGILSDRYSPKLPIAVGFLCLIGSFFWLALDNTPNPVNLIIALIFFGLGIPFILTPSFSTAMSSLPPQKTGIGFGIILTFRMLGGTIGLALIHLFTSLVQNLQAPIKDKYLATISSFSAVHFALAFLLIIAFAITFILHRRKSTHHLPDSPAEGWD